MGKEQGYRGSRRESPGGLQSTGGPPVVEAAPEAASYQGDPYHTNFPLPRSEESVPREAARYAVDPAAVLRGVDPAGPNSVVPLPGDALGGEEKIIGRDQTGELRRDLIGKWPFSALCHLVIDWPHKAAESGTAWLISSRLAITAGHCVYDHAAGRYASRIEVWVGRHGDTHLSRQFAEEFFVNDLYRTAGTDTEYLYDYGGVVLPQPVASSGTFGFHAYSNDELTGQTVNVVGYPALAPDRSNPNRHNWRFGELWGHAAALYSAADRVVYYTVDTSPGQSGAPVFRKVPFQDRTYYISVGVHSGGTHGRALNQAVRINPAVNASLVRWMEVIG